MEYVWDRFSNEIATAYRSWSDVPSADAGFGPFERREFPATNVIPSARLADLYATSSDVASLPEPVRRELLDRIRGLATEHPLHVPSGLEVLHSVANGQGGNEGIGDHVRDDPAGLRLLGVDEVAEHDKPLGPG